MAARVARGCLLNEMQPRVAMNRKHEMRPAKTIRSLTIATSLIAGATLGTGSHDAFAACAPRDHRTNCDSTPSPYRPNKNPPAPNPTLDLTVQLKKNNVFTNYSNPHQKILIGYNSDGTLIFETASIKIFKRANKDGSVDQVEEIRRRDGSVETDILGHTPPRPPKHVDLCGNMQFGVCW